MSSLSPSSGSSKPTQLSSSSHYHYSSYYFQRLPNMTSTSTVTDQGNDASSASSITGAPLTAAAPPSQLSAATPPAQAAPLPPKDKGPQTLAADSIHVDEEATKFAANKACLERYKSQIAEYKQELQKLSDAYDRNKSNKKAIQGIKDSQAIVSAQYKAVKDQMANLCREMKEDAEAKAAYDSKPPEQHSLKGPVPMPAALPLGVVDGRPTAAAVFKTLAVDDTQSMTTASGADDSESAKKKEEEVKRLKKCVEISDTLNSFKNCRVEERSRRDFILFCFVLLSFVPILAYAYMWATWRPTLWNFPVRLFRAFAFLFWRFMDLRTATWAEFFSVLRSSGYCWSELFFNLLWPAIFIPLWWLSTKIRLVSFIEPVPRSFGPGNHWVPVDISVPDSCNPKWSVFRYTGDNRSVSDLPFDLKADSVAAYVRITTNMYSFFGIPILPQVQQAVGCLPGAMTYGWIDLTTLAATQSKAFSGDAKAVQDQAARVVNAIFPQTSHGTTRFNRLNMVQATALIARLIVTVGLDETNRHISGN